MTDDKTIEENLSEPNRGNRLFEGLLANLQASIDSDELNRVPRRSRWATEA